MQLRIVMVALALVATSLAVPLPPSGEPLAESSPVWKPGRKMVLNRIPHYKFINFKRAEGYNILMERDLEDTTYLSARDLPTTLTKREPLYDEDEILDIVSRADEFEERDVVDFVQRALASRNSVERHRLTEVLRNALERLP